MPLILSLFPPPDLAGITATPIEPEVIERNVQPEHVHLIVSIPPKYSVSDFMGYLKGKMAIRLFQQYERLGRRDWGRHLWARGYCVSTIGLDEEQIRKYVQWQAKQEKQAEAMQGKLFDSQLTVCARLPGASLSSHRLWRSLFTLVQCGPVTPTPTAVPTAETPPNVQVQKEQLGPYLVGQNPPAGQRLELSSAIQFIFDRAMDQTKTADAFTLLDPTDQPVPVKIKWLDPQTFTFEPDSQLEPSAVYEAIFSTSAIGLDGKQLQEELRVEFTTIDSLAVGQVFPIDGAEELDPATNITVIFNHPVVPLRIEEEQTDLPQPLKFSPEVAGQGEWVNLSVYVFQPEKGLLSGTNYKVTVEAGLKDTSGDALDKSYSWNFSTRAPLIGSFALKNGAENPPETINDVLLDQAFIVTFLQPMDEESAREAVTLVNRETGAPFPTRLKWNKDFTALTIEPVGRYKIASFYDLTIADSARASDGGMLKEGWSLKFGTLPQILRIFPAPNSEAKDFDSSILINFASPMRLDSLKNKIKITPQPQEELQWYFDDYNWQLNIYGLEPATEYVVRILPGMADIYGNTIKGEQSFTFKTGDYAPFANLVLPHQPLIYRAQGPQEVFFEHRNLDSVTVSLYPLEFSEFSNLITGGQSSGSLPAFTFTGGGGGGNYVNFRPKVDPIRKWQPDVDVPRNRMNYLSSVHNAIRRRPSRS